MIKKKKEATLRGKKLLVLKFKAFTDTLFVSECRHAFILCTLSLLMREHPSPPPHPTLGHEIPGGRPDISVTACPSSQGDPQTADAQCLLVHGAASR